MQSRISCFNPTLLRKNLTRFWPLWGLASFVGVLFPLALLLDFIRRGPRAVPSAAEFSNMYYSVVAGALPVVSLGYAILCAMVVWSYLYSARSVSLMHTLPIRREGLFVTNFLSGMAMMLLPYAVTGALCVAISLGYGCFDIGSLLTTILVVIGESFFYFASATFVAFITGNIFALPVLYFLLHFLAVLLDWLISTFAQGFIFGFNSSYTGVAERLSPTVALMSRVGVDRTYSEIQRYEGTYTYQESVLTAVHLDGIWMIGVYALVGMVLLGLAYMMYRRRRSESAGDVVAVGWLRPVFRYGVAALSALLGGQLLYELFWYSFQSGSYYDLLPMTVCLVVAGVIGYYGASMLLSKSLRVFRRSWIGLGAVVLGCVAVCCALHFDVFGIAARVPETSEVRSVEIDVAGNSYTLYPEEDAALLEQVRALHQAVIADEAYIRDKETNGFIPAVPAGDYEWTWLWISYHQGGSAVGRYYSLPLTRERMAARDTYDALLDQLVNSTEMKAKRLHLDDSHYQVEGGSLYVEKTAMGYDLSDREAAAILEAVGRDMAAGNWGTYDWFAAGQGQGLAVQLDLRFSGSGEDWRGTDWINVVLWPEMTETVACLQELGLISQSDLLTYRELYPENYETETAATEAVYGSAVSAGRVSEEVTYTYEVPVVGAEAG